jgi:Terminase large subunit, T4likevirus-type, N-terminal
VTADELAELERYLTPAERAELSAIIDADILERPWTPLPGPQTMAYESVADIVGYGGAAGGGKTDLAAGTILTKSERALFIRREKAQTEGVVQRLQEIVGSTSGYSSQKGAWRIPNAGLLELGGLDNPGDERRWQGRPHDKKIFDEVTEMREQQVRFIMGWTRTDNPDLHAQVIMTFNPPTTSEGRWVISFFAPWLDTKFPGKRAKPGEIRYAAMLPDGKGGARDVWLERGDPFVMAHDAPCYEFDPADYRPEDIIKPKSRTFIPARLTDNPIYMATGYMSTLQSLPEPLRSQMLYGDFMAGVEDDIWQVIPTKWIEAAQARWKPRSPKGEMMQVGVDVARGGRDSTIISTRHRDEQAGHDQWYDELKEVKGEDTNDGDKCAGQVMLRLRDDAPVNIDVIGVGASPYDSLRRSKVQVWGVNVAVPAMRATDKSGALTFFNLRSDLWWAFREALDPVNDTGVALPPDPALLAELSAPRWSLSGKTIKVESRDEIIKRIGRSPDRATAVILAHIDQPKVAAIRAATQRQDVVAYDPYSNLS